MGTAMLTNTNVYQNRARYVCSPIDNSLNFHPSPSWNVTRSFFWLAGRGTRHLGHGHADQHQRLLESGSRGVLAFCPCLDLSTSAPMESLTLLSRLAGWWSGHLRDSKYG